MDAADDVRHHLPSQEECRGIDDDADTAGEASDGEADAADEVAEGNPPGGILEAPAPPEADALVPGSRAECGELGGSGRGWVNDDGDFGPRVEAYRARGRPPTRGWSRNRPRRCATARVAR